MSDPIVLTTAEQVAVAEYLENNTEHTTGGTGGWMLDVQHIIASINQVRAGDPFGTIRRTVGGTGVAVRIRYDLDDEYVLDEWHITWRDGRCEWKPFSAVRNWPVIFTPEVI